MIDRFKAFQRSLQEIASRGTAEYAKDTVEDDQTLKNLAIKLNQTQILSGYDSKGNPTGQYAARTIANRSKRGLQTQFKDYKYAGNFIRKFYVQIIPFLGAIFKIDSTDRKRDKIIEGSGNTPAAGEDLFGLSEDNLKVFREKFKPKFIRKLKNAIRYR